ncbi:MAG: hypothetical protein QM687_12340 [Ferruginibacter sp.]
MIRLLFSLFFLMFFFSTLQAQNITGQWKGEFVDNSSKFGNWGGDKCEYVLELEAKGSVVTGYSYTYFTNGDKRYYTICKLKGTYNKAKKQVEVTEYERTKTNVPVEIGNCFQVHTLTYFKQTEGNESLEGKWVPAPNQGGNCGYGLTDLVRRNLKNTVPGFKSSAAKPSNYSRVNVPKTTTAAAKKPAATKPVAGTTPKNIAPKNNSATTTPITAPPLTKKPTEAEPAELPQVKPSVPSTTISTPSKYEKRSNEVLSTIQLESDKIKVDLYDNGEIDGDSISVFLNGKLLMSHKKLTAQPLTIQLNRDELKDVNELVMYAENLGSIPPNTALMVVTDGTRRYEVRITSDLQKSGTIKFIKKGD